jgi:hypothetical protein
MSVTQPKRADFEASAEYGYQEALEHAKREGATALSVPKLMGFCGLACQQISKGRWIDAQPFFQEVFRRVENHLIPGVRTKADACRQIGCSVRWAEMIVAGTAKESNKSKANKKRIECEVSSHAQPAPSAEEVMSNILRYADNKLRLLASENWDRYRSVCELLENFFAGLAAAAEASS